MGKRGGGRKAANNRSAINIVGLNEFRADLKEVGPEWGKEVSKVNREVKNAVVKWGREDLTRLGGVHRKSARGLTGWASQKSASAGVKPGGRYPWATVGVWGALKRTGWYAAPRYARRSIMSRIRRRKSGTQHPAWVGADWQVGKKGEGPYGLNEAIADHVDEIAEMHRDGLLKVAARAFPDS